MVFVKIGVCCLPCRRNCFFFNRPLKSEVAAQPAESRHLVGHGIVGFRNAVAAQMVAENPVDTAGDGAHIIAGGRQAQPAVGNNAATAGKI